MGKTAKTLSFLILAAAIIVLATFALTRVYDASAFFRSLFMPHVAAESAAVNYGSVVDQTRMLESQARFSGKISMIACAVITMLQCLAFLSAAIVCSGIRRGDDPVKSKLKRLDNADIFFDLPLYIGLFGSVTAFLMMTYAPQSSKVVAYSSTMIGIIFSVVLRVAMLYPFRRRLLDIQSANDGDSK